MSRSKTKIGRDRHRKLPYRGEIEKLVPKASIDDRYRDTPYYLAPEDKVGQEAFAEIRDAMKKKQMASDAS